MALHIECRFDENTLLQSSFSRYVNSFLRTEYIFYFIFYSQILGNPLLCDCVLKEQMKNTENMKKFKDLDQVVCTNDPNGGTVQTYITALNCGKLVHGYIKFL